MMMTRKTAAAAPIPFKTALFEQSKSLQEQNATKIKQGEMPRLGPGLIAHEFGHNAARGRD